MEKKSMIDIKNTWPLWLTVLATGLNFIGVLLFLSVMYYIRDLVISNPVIEGRIDSYLAIVGYSSALGILTLIAGSSLVILLNPWINFKKLMDGDGSSKIPGAIIFASVVLSLTFIVMAPN